MQMHNKVIKPITKVIVETSDLWDDGLRAWKNFLDDGTIGLEIESRVIVS